MRMLKFGPLLLVFLKVTAATFTTVAANTVVLTEGEESSCSCSTNLNRQRDASVKENTIDNTCQKDDNGDISIGSLKNNDMVYVEGGNFYMGTNKPMIPRVKSFSLRIISCHKGWRITSTISTIILFLD